MAAIFDSPLTLTSDSIHYSPVALPDPENRGIAVGMLLLSRMQAEIYVSSYVLPVHGGHLWSVTYADVGQFPNLLHRVAGPQKCKDALTIALLSCIEPET